MSDAGHLPEALRPEVRAGRLVEKLARYRTRAAKSQTVVAEGRLVRMVGLTLEAEGCQISIGGRCRVISAGGHEVEAEVVGFSAERTFLMPVGDVSGLTPGARVIPTRHARDTLVGDALLGRVLDGSGRPLDGRPAPQCDDHVSLNGRSINPLARRPIHEPLDVGVRAINGLLTVGRGQRMGLFAGSGVGKSVLLGMMTRYTTADITVVGLIGERGREVNEFVQNILGPEGMARAVVVAVPADHPPLMRLHGAMLATSIAEYFRDQGHNVLLLMDSLTRFAQAQREISLAIGEPPATKGYTPSVFAKLPQLVERAGNGDQGSGSITAFYTVLAEGDDTNDPIADAARAILDGHVVLSRRIADTGRYPAIDIEASVSRVMNEIVDPGHIQAARRFKQLYSHYQQNRDLISVGAYQRGSDPRVDEAVAMHPRLEQYLQQDMHQSVGFKDSLKALDGLMEPPAPSSGDDRGRQLVR
ncbi:flagellar protein export ATPase FliI [Ectothiorhodospira lacustris]|uniref:flagellar protein export ATPase FliI n=1 Tax=Ectothiorhodospira lacustris TaxID=2899127 RepID=UPI001EE8B016|nr:flagellar protein export ATPase FliI [Ectothiorhodospira lacustris]MCG5499527.1 flagellar protein export ATPase FliI [Ectothiorhodospira lacustris]MCG5511105.1 flagellar protein export ATPase FliI [Ectothiorhodospira lacustris]MCG5522887.1 flagellar protein export ATPase FliI [Ectothiorhodospira lacustris]